MLELLWNMSTLCCRLILLVLLIGGVFLLQLPNSSDHDEETSLHGLAGEPVFGLIPRGPGGEIQVVHKFSGSSVLKVHATGLGHPTAVLPLLDSDSVTRGVWSQAHSSMIVGTIQGKVWFVDPDRRVPSRLLGDMGCGISSLELSRDGRCLCVGNLQGQVGVWDLSTGTSRIWKVCSEEKRIHARFTANWEAIVAATDGVAAGVWNSGSGDILANWTLPMDQLDDIQIVPGTSHVVCGGMLGRSRVVQMIDLKTNRKIWSNEVAEPAVAGGFPVVLAVKEDGQHVAVGRGPELTLLNCLDGSVVARNAVEKHQISCLVWKEAHHQILTGGWDGTICCWDVNSLFVLDSVTLPEAELGTEDEGTEDEEDPPSGFALLLTSLAQEANPHESLLVPPGVRQ